MGAHVVDGDEFVEEEGTVAAAKRPIVGRITTKYFSNYNKNRSASV